MKKLIIVCEEKLRTYGDFLAQLISRVDDDECAVVGVKDGEVAAQVWTEKEYVNNAVQLSSEQYILFVGDSKVIKEKRTFMQQKFSNFGMNYGWLGKQAVLFVDRVVSLGDYDDFFALANAEFAKGDQPEIANLLTRKSKLLALSENIENDTVCESENLVNATDISETSAREKKLPINASIKKVATQGVGVVKKATNNIVGNINRIAKNKSIEDQEYSCLVLLFYLNGLSDFLGLSEGK